MRQVVAVYTCDHQYTGSQYFCAAKIKVKASGAHEYEMNDEAPLLEKRGWTVWGFKTFCKAHKADGGK